MFCNVIFAAQIHKMEPVIRKLEIKRTAHIAEIGNDISKSKEIWMIMHGYGQLANRIVRKFDKFDMDDVHAIAPEGLNKFYWHDGAREPVSTWMTSHERLDEIADYLAYLDQVYEQMILPHLDDANFNILGFSQGSATMWRWVMHRKPQLSKLVQWAGEFPPEPDYKNQLSYLNNIDMRMVYGDKDSFIKGKHKDKVLAHIATEGLDMKIQEYEGLHRIDRKVLGDIVNA